MKILPIKIMLLMAVITAVSACRSEVRPAIVPGVEVKTPESDVAKDTMNKHSLGIIGAVEPIYFLPMKKPFMARIDTGAETSSIDVANRTIFERDGEQWVAFDLVNREYGETHHFEKKVERRQKVKRIEGREKRTVVMMSVRFGGEIIRTQFSLAERDKFSYQGLIGRNILNGRAVVDTSLSNTLK
ncbi:MAG: RimK/LysX family protein [Rhodospirillales bacterium]|nr:RimK/LysX family protein [Rhodospirillales bacterium]